MSQENTSRHDLKHHPVMIALHWITLASILFAVTLVLIREGIEARETRQLLMDGHRMIGLFILSITAFRLVLRYALNANKVDHGLPRLLDFMSKAGHLALYSLLFIIPLLGWACASAAGKLILFGRIVLPALVSRNQEMAEILGDGHELAAWALLLAVLGHAGAALWHHFFRRDTVLHSMLPLVSVSNAHKTP